MWDDALCRESKKSAQQILHQLEQLSLPLLESVNSSLHKSVTYDGALSSWQELYRLVSCLNFGTGLATGCATLQSVSLSQQRFHLASFTRCLWNILAVVTLRLWNIACAYGSIACA